MANAEHVDGKVVEGNPAEFGESKEKPDSLDGVVKEVKAENQADPNNYSKILYKNCALYKQGFKKFDIENIFGCFDKILSADDKRGLFSDLTEFEKIVTSMSGKTAMKIILPKLKVAHIKRFLELPENYGPELSKSGLYEMVGLHLKENNYDIDREYFLAIEERFPEVKHFNLYRNYNNEVFLLINNPFNAIMAVNPALRPMITNATYHAYQNGLNIENLETIQPNFPLTTKQIYDYARSINQVEKSLIFDKALL